jgi:hypothetical protein
MQLIGKAITFVIMVGFITLIIEAILYEREVSGQSKQERPFYE